MSRPTLYGISGSRAIRSLWAIEEVGIDYEHVPVTYGEDSKDPEYLEVNPNGRIPALVDGELTVFDPHPRSATVEAVEPTHVLEVEGEDLEGLMSESVEVLRAIVRMLSRRLRENTETIAFGLREADTDPVEPDGVRVVR